MMPDAATPGIDRSSSPQRLDKILAALHYFLLHDEQVHDYRFAVDPADHHHILRDGFPKLTKLNKLLGHRLSFHFNPITGELTISNMDKTLQFELRLLLVNQLRAGASTVNPRPLITTTLGENKLASEVASSAIAIFPSISNAEPTPCTIATIEAVGDRMPKSALAHVMTCNPGIQTMVGLYLGGLVKRKFTSEADRNHRMKRIGDKSVVMTCTRIENGIDIKTEPLSKEDGTMHVPVAANSKIVVAVKYADILDVISTVGTFGPLGAVPEKAAPNAPNARNPPNSGMQASMWPFPGLGITARASGYRLGGTNHIFTGLRVPPLGNANHSSSGYCLGDVNRSATGLRTSTRAINPSVVGLRVWGTLLGRLLRR
ncbi:hypothetical protein B0T25DRAFT_582104 [Lasiosphaeria hispida]|uniref:Uncharacterized protein n=1 Tax=Lasiosphaeria hispida TaxID=260671 RepID=A0AAJ0HEG5_9PEZI|nr:hypothetical protein B0T25DRAFT_582104 [Lasiosphaeria hispida]